MRTSTLTSTVSITSLGRQPGPVGRALVGALIVLIAAPAVAAPKKKKKAGDSGETAPAAPTRPASQEIDKERPKTMVGGPLVAPPKDTLGRLHYGSPSATNVGKVTVKAPATDKIQVLFDGRYFGTAPLTIHSIPRGDYIVEGNFPDGKTVTKPVTVVDNETATVELAPSPEAAPPPTRPSLFDAEMTPKRLKTAKVLAITGGGFLLLGGIFGYLKYSKEKEYGEPGKTQAQLDDIANTGKRYSLIANLSFALGGVALVGAAWAAYPMFFGPKEKPGENPTTPPRTSFLLLPGPGGASGSVAWTF
ncbi:MAG TPA: PEGA domain-containing protein [Polyangia bacterium]|nr:PEGA domain-containing protein [Polyangia bacterium]